jgi:regulation of enolase protein 1 (concanavalin A-like superfamily)
MKLVQLKWIGLALLATILSAVGAVAVSYASAGVFPAGANANLATAGPANLADAPDLQAGPASPHILKGWGEAIDPDGDCSIDLENGRLTIKVPQVPGKGHGLEAEYKTLNAPRVLRDIEGDFIADLKVEGTFRPLGGSAKPNSFPFVGAGLLLWSDAGNYIRLERAAIVRQDQLLSYALFEERTNSRPVPPGGGLAVPDGPTVLRLERKGSQITASVSADGTQWRAFPPRTVQFPAKLKLGVAAISSSGEPFTVTLANFRVLRPE